MKVALLAAAFVFVIASMLTPTSPAHAVRVVFVPDSGYCLSGAHVRRVKNCREFGGVR
jgi:hypothetical protein